MDEARYTKEVALKVDAAIKTAGENSNSVAVAAGIPRTTLNRHLLGKTPGFTAVQLHSIAQHLGMSASDFTPDAAE